MLTEDVGVLVVFKYSEKVERRCLNEGAIFLKYLYNVRSKRRPDGRREVRKVRHGLGSDPL